MEKYQAEIDAALELLNRISKDTDYTDIRENILATLDNLSRIRNYSPCLPDVAKSNESVLEFVAFGNDVAISKFIGFNEEAIVIPDTYNGKIIRRILPSAFENCESIKSIVLGKNISVIEDSAFANCKRLESVVINSNLRFIGHSVFLNCKKLKTINLSHSIHYIGDFAFSGTSIDQFIAPENLYFLSSGLFENCSNLRTVYLHNEILGIGSGCFTNCKKLTEISLPASVKLIGEHAFLNCISIKTLEIYAMKIDFKEDVFSKTYIWQPDRRYNPRICYEPLDTITVLCKSKSTSQIYCRNNKIKYASLECSDTAEPKINFTRLEKIMAVTFDIENTELDFLHQFVEENNLSCYLKNGEYNSRGIIFSTDDVELNLSAIEEPIEIDFEMSVEDVIAYGTKELIFAT